MFEIAVIRGMESNHDRHPLGERKRCRSLTMAFARRYLFLLPKRFKYLAKIVNIAIQFRKIHSYPLHFRFLARNDGEDNFLRLFAPIAVS
jgi:hypothetical protein